MKVRRELISSSRKCAARFFAVGVLLAVTVLAASSAQAVPTYEGFDYTANTALTSQNGGTGWNTPWGWYLGDNPNYTNMTASLADPTATLTTTGGHVESGAGGFMGRYNTYPSYGANGTTAYFSFLLRPDDLGTTGDPGGGNGGFILQLFQNTGNGDLGIGKNGTDSTWGLEHNGIRVASATTPVLGQTVLLVLRADYTSGADTFQLYINPTGQTQPGVADATISYDIGTQDGLAFNVFNGAKASFDELRIGTTWADVTPGLIPEPSTFAFAALGTALLIGYRTRRNAKRA